MKIAPPLRLTVATLLFLSPVLALSQRFQPNRIATDINDNSIAAVSGSRHPLALPQYDRGPLSGSTQLTGLSIHFQLSAAQQADLNQLLADQQNPASAQYHQWLTPAEFGARFGLSDLDLAKVQSWLQQQGFQVDSVSQSRNRITFSGTAGQVASAFHTELHQYNVNGESHFANATALSIPAALFGVVLGVQHLNNFRPQPHVRRASPEFTSSISGNHYIAPDDFNTIYNVKALYTAGFDGTGQTIAAIGQSAILNTDVEHFQAAAGLPKKDPTIVLVPNTGVSTVNTGDETESDLDVEWAGAIAKGATIKFVYTGCTNSNCSTTQFGAFDALAYAVDQNLAPIISNSYGICEQSLTLTDIGTFEAIFQQANAQGQTIISAAGDSGAADCDNSTSTKVVSSATHGLAVDFPGSAPYVTSIGGTEFNDAATDWSGTNNANGGSAAKYIPETVWNDSSTANGFSSTGGGKSIFFAKPSWQNGAGVPADGARDVPDISVDASNGHDPYLFCSTDAGATSCSSGFRDSSSNLTAAGGTSFGAPTFSGVLAIIAQKVNAKGLGNINPSLYALNVSAPTGFHDITTGNNTVPCTVGSSADCTTGTIGFNAAAGYDQATGLGSIEANNLATGFAALSLGSLATATTTTITSSVAHPTLDTGVTFNASVAANGTSSSSPTGTVQFAVDGTNSGSPVALTAAKSSAGVAIGGTAALTVTAGFTTAGSHTITATYSGDSTYGSSAATLTVTVSATGSYALTASSVTVAQGSSGASNVTATPAGGYKGTIAYTMSAPATLTSSCYSITSSQITSTSPVTTTLTIFTKSTDCVGAANRRHFNVSGGVLPTKSSSLPRYLGAAGTALASVFLIGLPGFRRRRGTAIFSLLVLATLGFAVGCGGGSSGGSSGGAKATLSPKGTYALTLTGTDSTNNLTNSANFTLTIQ